MMLKDKRQYSVYLMKGIKIGENLFLYCDMTVSDISWRLNAPYILKVQETYQKSRRKIEKDRLYNVR